MFMAPPLAEMALQFGPPEYFALMLLGLIILTFILAGIIHRNADNLQTLRSVLILQFDQPGSLDLARPAPRRPLLTSVKPSRMEITIDQYR